MVAVRPWGVALLALVLLPGTAWAQPAPPVEVEGATYAELDDRSGVWTLRGSPVAVRRGVVTVQAPVLTYDRRAGVVRATGGARYTDEELSVDAPQIAVWLEDERMLADGGVAAEQRPERRRLVAARLEVFRRERRLVATGTPVVTGPEGRLAADRIEAFGEREEITAEGDGRFVYEEIDGRAPRITLRRRPATATLTGGAVVRQGPHEVRAQTITVELERRRIVASGQAMITVQPVR